MGLLTNKSPSLTNDHNTAQLVVVVYTLHQCPDDTVDFSVESLKVLS